MITFYFWGQTGRLSKGNVLLVFLNMVWLKIEEKQLRRFWASTDRKLSHFFGVGGACGRVGVGGRGGGDDLEHVDFAAAARTDTPAVRSQSVPGAFARTLSVHSPHPLRRHRDMRTDTELGLCRVPGSLPRLRNPAPSQINTKPTWLIHSMGCAI